jgi:hypothetical protein
MAVETDLNWHPLRIGPAEEALYLQRLFGKFVESLRVLKGFPKDGYTLSVPVPPLLVTAKKLRLPEGPPGTNTPKDIAWLPDDGVEVTYE